MKHISILGSTGSIGRQTLEIISEFSDKFRVVGLSAGSNINLIKEQVEKFKPEIVSVRKEKDAEMLSKELRGQSVEILSGEAGAKAVASHPKADTVVSAMVGASGLLPTLAAVKSKKNIALANKEALVMAGNLLIREAEKSGVSILPVDSEHSAIFQALGTNKREFITRLILTASGGPFLRTPKEKLENVTVETALNHPTWKMGRKITIDSATLMNKGFEIIEATWLFGISADKISVWIHPQSIVHSMVEFVDGSIIAQMGHPDMKIPISYAISYPDRIPTNCRKASAASIKELTFEDVSLDKFPALCLAYRALEVGGTMPAVMNGANEVAVHAFLEEKLKFIEIIKVVKQVMDLHKTMPGGTIEEIIESDAWARKTAESMLYN